MTDEALGAAKPLLTIAIPTYNRAEILKQLLSELAGQLENDPRVELIVCDNASPDATQAVVDEYRKCGLAMLYVRNESNLGADRNILQCFSRAGGKYVLVLGDDDYILPGGLAKLLQILSGDEEYDLVYLPPRSSWGAKRGSQPRSVCNFRVATADPVRFSRIVTVTGDLINISTIVTNKDRVSDVMPESCEDMIGSHVIQLAWVFSALGRARQCLIADDDIVRCGRGRPHGGFNAASVFVVNYVKAMDLWLGPAQSRLKRSLIDDLMVFWFSNWIGMRRHPEMFSTQDSRQLVRALAGHEALSGSRLRYWLFVIPLVWLPIHGAAAWNRILMLLRRRLLARRVLGAVSS